MVVKSKVESKHVSDLGSIFKVLREHKLRLNAFNALTLLSVSLASVRANF